jgi:hypothetical protein
MDLNGVVVFNILINLFHWIVEIDEARLSET